MKSEYKAMANCMKTIKVKYYEEPLEYIDSFLKDMEPKKKNKNDDPMGDPFSNMEKKLITEVM